MKKKDNRSVAQKIADINNLWDNQDKFAEVMPNREMFYCGMNFGNDCECNSDEHQEKVESIYLDGTPDWLAWELEMME